MAKGAATPGPQAVLELVEKLENLPVLSAEAVSRVLGQPFTRHEGNDSTQSYYLENQGLFSKVEMRRSTKDPRRALLILELDPKTKLPLDEADKHFGGDQTFHPGSPHASPDVPTASFEYKRAWGKLSVEFLDLKENLVRTVVLDRFEPGNSDR